MSYNSKIEWTDATWNFLGGCSPCSPGCANCAAARLAAGRLKNHPLYKGLTKNGKWTGEVRLCTDIDRGDILEQPLHWRKHRTIFPCFMGDLFHEKVPFEFIDEVFAVMALMSQHTSLVLTKRIERALKWFQDERMTNWADGTSTGRPYELPLPNIHLGVSISNQAEADEKIPILLQIPAVVRWLSIEPMLEGMDISRYLISTDGFVCPNDDEGPIHVEDGGVGVDGIVVGGESGPKARPMHPWWVRNIRDQCVAAGVPFYFKQWGKYVTPNQTSYSGDHKGWRFPVEPEFMKYDGTHSSVYPSGGTSAWTKIYPIGKKKAGRLLDGKVWDQLPTPAAID